MRSIFLMLFVLPLLGASSCSALKYKSDAGFLNSAQAGSYEFPIKVNGKPCKDIDGNIGACAKQLPSDQKLVIDLPARQYAYRLNVLCSMPLEIDYPVDVQADKPYRLEVKPEVFSSVLSFTCKGEVTPYDRNQKVSAMWHVRVLIYDTNYEKREVLYTSKGYAVFGAFAKYADICDDSGCRDLKEGTYTKYKGKFQAFSESETMRFNHYGY